jgi:hypothetical protein
MWELYEEAERRYLDQIVKIHPDVGGEELTDSCATLNDTWTRIKVLFKRKYNISRDA